MHKCMRKFIVWSIIDGTLVALGAYYSFPTWWIIKTLGQ